MKKYKAGMICLHKKILIILQLSKLIIKKNLISMIDKDIDKILLMILEICKTYIKFFYQIKKRKN